ncbi:MAG: hypothetical protein M1814_002698 [Vezdaea aestivalis]|nr:MAG: hypothetical protein M1814_002698 [Vezdaea aestivalis]
MSEICSAKCYQNHKSLEHEAQPSAALAANEHLSLENKSEAVSIKEELDTIAKVRQLVRENPALLECFESISRATDPPLRTVGADNGKSMDHGGKHHDSRNRWSQEKGIEAGVKLLNQLQESGGLQAEGLEALRLIVRQEK